MCSTIREQVKPVGATAMGDTRPAGLKARYYIDPEIFARSWQLVGHTSQVASAGQLITASVGDSARHRGRTAGHRPRGFTVHHAAQGPAPERSAYTRMVEANDYAAFFRWPVSSIQCYPGQVLNTFRWVPVAVGTRRCSSESGGSTAPTPRRSRTRSSNATGQPQSPRTSTSWTRCSGARPAAATDRDP